MDYWSENLELKDSNGDSLNISIVPMKYNIINTRFN